MHRFLCSLIATAAAVGGLGAATGVVAQEAAPTMSIGEIERGQRGYGLSVFAGSEPERFEVEVLGVMRDTGPGQSYILARLSGQGLEETGVVAGMSGSPVYIDDRLVGAVAFSWIFTNGAVGGITPIESMLALSEAAAGAPGSTTGELPTLPGELRRASLDAAVLSREIARLRPALPVEARSGVVWSLSGFGAESRSLLERAPSAATPPAEAAAPASSHLPPGSALPPLLVNGDMKIAVTGTVTERVGDEIFAFGHRFTGQGALSLPMASAEVVTVLSSELISFKIANVGRVVGGFELDRASGVRGRLGAAPPTIPLDVSLAGEGAADFHMELADVPGFLPILVAISSLGVLDATTQAAGAQGLDLRVRWDLDGYEPLELAQRFDGDGAGIASAIYLLLMTNYLVNNPLEEVRLESVSIELEQHATPRTARILRGFANRSTVRPGDRVEVTLELQPYQGATYKRSVPVEIPADLPVGTYTLMLGDGVTMDAVRTAVEQVVPETFGQSLAMVRRFDSNRDLVVLGLARGWGLSLAGRVLPQLPDSVRGLWRNVAPGAATPVGLAIVQDIEIPVERPLSGLVRIDLQIEAPATVAPVGARKEVQ